ncbi:MAG: lytic transglycosylase domain-containing protein [Thioalkalivibrio sp.]
MILFHRNLILTGASALLLSLGLPSPEATAQGQIHIHRGTDGTQWFTDRRNMGPDYSYVGSYGRPTASHACHGVNRRILDERAAPYLTTVRHYAGHYGVDPNLVHAVITVESCFDRQAVSRVGARGLMQLMPATAQELGVQDSFDAMQNIRGGVRYLHQMLEQFNQDTTLALAAYNAGPGAVRRHNGVPPFNETQNYITRVMDHYQRLSTD